MITYFLFLLWRYFDGYGIIRDIVHSHILQTIALLAMETPISLDGEDIRNEKVCLHVILLRSAYSCFYDKLIFRPNFWDQSGNWSPAMLYLANIKGVLEIRLIYLWTAWPPHISLLHCTLTMHAGMVCRSWSKLAWDSSNTGYIHFSTTLWGKFIILVKHLS